MTTKRHDIKYTRKEDGSYAIIVNQPWDGQHRFDSFPAHIRFAVMRNQDYVTDDNTLKLKTAKAISADHSAMVLDDILCEAAEDLARKEKEYDTAMHLARDGDHEPGNFVGLSDVDIAHAAENQTPPHEEASEVLASDGKLDLEEELERGR